MGPLGLIETLIVLGLILVQVRRYPERAGGYLVGMSILPVIILGSIVARMPACPVHGPTQCYVAITVPALILYALAGLVGAILVGRTLRRLWAGSKDDALGASS